MSPMSLSVSPGAAWSRHTWHPGDNITRHIIRGRDHGARDTSSAWPRPAPWSPMSLIASDQMRIVSHYVSHMITCVTHYWRHIGRCQPADRITGELQSQSHIFWTLGWKYSGLVIFAWNDICQQGNILIHPIWKESFCEWDKHFSSFELCKWPQKFNLFKLYLEKSLNWSNLQ